MIERQLLLFESGDCEVGYRSWRPWAENFENLNVLDVALDFFPNNIKKGKKSPNYRGLCPFHDHNPEDGAFAVKPDRNFFKCYGCGRDGGPLSLLIGATSNPLAYLSEKFGFDPLKKEHRDVLERLLLDEGRSPSLEYLSYGVEHSNPPRIRSLDPGWLDSIFRTKPFENHPTDAIQLRLRLSED